MVVIALSGLPGTGSSTAGKLLAKKLKLKYFSVGAWNKSHAKKFSGKEVKGETDKSVVVWRTKKGASSKFHFASDDISRKKAKQGNIVIDGKLAIWALKDISDFSVWIKAPLSIRAKRIAGRDGITVEKAKKLVKEKEKLERKNWRRIYGFDYFVQEKEADLVINTAKKKPEEIVDLIISRLRRIFIVHRWESRPKNDWYPYAKKELERRGYSVNVLRMPSPDRPIMKKWVSYLSKNIGKPNEYTYLIGHSAGVITILRYLEQLPENAKIGGCILVAGWIDDLGYKELSNFFSKPIRWKKIRQHCKKFVAIHSDNDPFVKIYHGEAFRKHLKAKLIIEHSKGHFTDEDEIRKLPSVVKSMMNLNSMNMKIKIN